MNRTYRSSLKNSPRLLLLTFVFAASGCAPIKSMDSDLLAPTSLCGRSLNLVKYLANKLDYSGLRQELGSMGTFSYRENYLQIFDRQLRDADPHYEVAKQDLVPEEKVAIAAWTSDLDDGTGQIFQQMNFALRNPEITPKVPLDSTIRTLSSAINKLKGNPCQGMRGVGRLPDSLLKLPKNARFIEHGFSAFTLGTEAARAYRFNPIKISVISDLCKEISAFSQYPSEFEMLFPPGSVFEVIENKKVGNSVQLDLRHIPPEE